MQINKRTINQLQSQRRTQNINSPNPKKREISVSDKKNFGQADNQELNPIY